MLYKEINPKNRGKPKFKIFTRKLEDLIKNLFLIFILFFSFLNLFKIKNKKIISLNNYIDIYSINYFIFSLSSKYYFSYDFNGSLSLIKRIGVKTFLKNCVPNLFFIKSSINVCYNNENNLNGNDLNFNFDYFNLFDKDNFNEIKEKKSLFLPYYTRSEFYKNNYFKKFSYLKNSTKKFSIIFSGSNHVDWYEQLKWPINNKNKENILTRSQILNFIINEYKDEVQVIKDRSEINKIDYNKKIILFISDPSKKRKLSKILTMQEHMYFTSISNFFLTCPGTAMPLSHHIIESMFLGTVPITSYGHLMFPRLENNINSLMFNNYLELKKCIDLSLTISQDKIFQLKKSTITYYEQSLSPSSFLKKFETYKMPLNLYMNVDGHTLDSRRERFGLNRLFPKPKS